MNNAAYSKGLLWTHDTYRQEKDRECFAFSVLFLDNTEKSYLLTFRNVKSLLCVRGGGTACRDEGSVVP